MKTSALRVGTLTFLGIWSLVIGAFLFGSASAYPAEKKLGGPKGGRLLEKTNPQAEFFLEKDRTATITFYNADLKPVPAKDQAVALIAGKDKIDFETKGDILVTKSKLPDGDALPLVVQFKPTADAKPQNYRFKLETHTCTGCNRAEYACTCDE